jgi:hypothetical protein
MVQIFFTYLAILVYLVMAYRFFTEWLDFFLEDEEMNSRERYFFGIILVLASILWIIVVPLAYLELLKFHKKHQEIIDLLMSLSRAGISED